MPVADLSEMIEESGKRWSPMSADGAIPRPPTKPPVRSDRMSPNMFSVTITSNCFCSWPGPRRTIRILRKSYSGSISKSASDISLFFINFPFAFGRFTRAAEGCHARNNIKKRKGTNVPVRKMNSSVCVYTSSCTVFPARVSLSR